MLDTGRVAGKILGGLEKVLGPERGRFEAKTAKYVPHQKHNNQCKADPAPSGPYVVAFVKYLYENPSYFEALRRSFKIGDWDKNRKDMEFDSLRTRIEMQELFRHEHEKSQSVGELPLKITPEVFRILGPKILGPLLATAYRGFDGRQDVVDFDTFRWNGDEDYPPGEGSQSDEGDPPGERSQGDKGNKPSENPPPPRDDDKEMYDTDEEDDDDDDFTYYPNDPESVISKAVLRNEIRENTQLYSGIRTKQEYYRRAYENVRGIERTVRETPPIAQETQSIVRETQSIVRETPPPEEESPPQRKYKSKLKLPPGISALPSDFGNEQVVSNTELDAWRNANTELLKSLGLDDRARKANHTSFRAGLHALSGVTFPDEKAGRLVDIWLNDDEVFNTSDRRRLRRESSGVIAQRMKDKYEVFDRELLSQRRSSSRRSRSTPVVSPGGAKSRGVNLGTTTASNIERPKVRLPARTRVVQYPKGFNKDNVPEFARIAITGPNFINFQRLNLDLFPNNDPGAVGEMTRRAILHRTYHGSFKGVSVRSMTDWKNDPRAFTAPEIKDKIRIKIPKEEAEQRLDTIYYNLDPPMFSSLSDSELERWTENLPPEVIEGLTPANVRGRLHRLFVGEFEELRTAQAEQNEKNMELLADWRKALGQDSGSADEVVDALISMYGPPPDEPFLAVSPIHWPSPEYLLSRQQGTKRKASTAPTQAKKRAKGKK
ncbi:cysteine-type peptidase [Pyrenophora seminiperda CCB06]|uniref:Cysteine-type peptidase n=1 Tax=Pyrenophora seminiperda CCB06 TaxID=1302712 RepID=A0A3M7MFT6_9PLEO|nr:cysteine-type peptidase [Pyrenophora seminiperda CCB06]